MPLATLLLRESSAVSLTQAVERALQRKPPLLEYDLQLTSCQLDFVLMSKPEKFPKSSSLDEGFESDVDSVSIVSSDESFTSTPTTSSKSQETDSANGSACSDSDDTDSTTTVNTVQSKYSTLKRNDPQHSPNADDKDKPCPEQENKENPDQHKRESFSLVDCLCYTDVNALDLLLFVIKDEVLVFRLANQNELQKFYGAFTALKAVSNQKAYNNTLKPSKFNLLQRTDSNGVTHIEISRDPNTKLVVNVPTKTTSSIISINTPEDKLASSNIINKALSQKSRDDILLAKSCTLSRKTLSDFRANTISKFGSLYLTKDKNKNFNSRQRAESALYTIDNEITPSSNLLTNKAISTDNILSDLCIEEEDVENNIESGRSLKKVWNSVEDLLGDKQPKKPERKKKLKGPAPQPPTRTFKQNVLKGSYVRVNVPKFEPKLIVSPTIEVNNINTKPQEKIFDHKATILRASLPEKKESNLSKFQNLTEKAKNTLLKPKLTTYQQFKYSEPKKLSEAVSTLTRSGKGNLETNWMSSVPRMVKKQSRSRSETRNFTPMAYRYIDTTQNSYLINNSTPASSNFQLVNPSSSSYQNQQVYQPGGMVGTFQRNKNYVKADVNNRLFGMSSKLRDFSASGGNQPRSETDGRYSSLGDLTYTLKYNNTNNTATPDTNLKSVIKKDDGKKKNEKKVTFSAYTTVQVV